MRTPATFDTDLEIGPHKAIAAYLELAWPEDLPWTHFPAGEKRETVERVDKRSGRTYRFSPAGARLKAMGLHPGWFDFQFILPNAQFATAEVKRLTGDFSAAQIEHRRKLLALGVAVATWRTPEDAERTVTRWLAAFSLKPRATLSIRRTA